MRNERGEIVTLLFIIIVAMMIAGGVALSYGTKCDPAVQRCVDEKTPTHLLETTP